MKKQLFLLSFIFLNSLIFSQQLIDSGEGYSEVVAVEMNKDEIYNSLKEWISVAYKSANEVIQLDIKEKLVAKGNTDVNMMFGEYNSKFKLYFTLILSIKDNKYKIDLTPTKIRSELTPSTSLDSGTYKILMTNEVMSQENYLVIFKKIALRTYKDMGFSNKKSQRMLKKSNETLVKGYDSYKLNKIVFEEKIKSIYDSIKNAINKKDEDW
jgi:hypothetical protein